MELLSWLNDVLYDGLPYALTVMSFVITFRYLNFPDLTAAGSFVFGAAVAAIAVVNFGINPFLALLFALAAGAAAGAATAFFNVVLRINRLLAGILGAFFLYGINQLLLSPTLPYGSHATVLAWAEWHDRQIAVGNLPWHPCAIVIFGLVVGGVKLLLDWYFHSELGLALRALEDADAGEEVLRRNGLSPDRFRFAGVVMANALVGLSGAVISMRESAANAHRGFDVLVTGLVAYLMGVSVLSLMRRIVRHRNGNGVTGLARIARIEPTTVAVLGTLLYFGLIDVSQRIQIRPELTRIVLVLSVVAAVGDLATVKKRFLTLRRSSASFASAEAPPLVSLRNISFGYPNADEDCIENANLEIGRGERLKLEGANGSGKTTLMKIASGLLAPSAGEILLEGNDVTKDSATRLRNVVYVDQNPQRGVVGSLTVEENLLLAQAGATPSLWRKAADARKTDVLQRVVQLAALPLSHLQRDAQSLSGGQRQITNLLTLLARENLPPVVMLDEPTNNLDAEHIARCKGIIKELRDRGAAVVLVSHTGLEQLPVDRVVRLQAPGHGGRAPKGE